MEKEKKEKQSEFAHNAAKELFERLDKALTEGTLVDKGIDPDDSFPVCEFTGDEIF